MRRMLINATQPEEIRLAMVDGQKLLNFEIEQFGREQRRGNIYKAVITRIEPSLEACFVDYGEERQGFLPLKEVSRDYFAESETPLRQMAIDEALHVGQELLVQVEREERGNKNAALTTFISLASRYLVLMPNKPRSGGISRRTDGEEKQDLRDAMRQLKLPRGMSLIARTAGIGREADELQWDLDYLLGLWEAISDAANATKGSFLIYNESALVIRAIRDYYSSDIKEILVDTESFYHQARQFMEHIIPNDVDKVKFYQDDTALFARFQIEKQIETAFAREVRLPSGGSIVLDHTEALVAVDVNSARSTRGSDIEETATNTNLEAAEEIARQLRFRDLGGLIVIDFIDMGEQQNRLDVENKIKQALRQDRARVQFSSISRFGLLELSRQRLRPALYEGASIACPRCNGTGHIRDTESTSLQILRRIQEDAPKDNTAAIKIQVPIDVASYLLNKKREEITKIEINNGINVVLIPNRQLETPNYVLERLKEDDPQLEHLQNTYTVSSSIEESDAVISKAQPKTNRQEPVIKSYMPKAPTPQVQVAEKKKVEKTESGSGTGFWGWLKGLFTGSDSDESQGKKKSTDGRRRDFDRDRNNPRNNERRQGRGRDQTRNRRGRGTDEQGDEQQSNDRSNNRRGSGSRDDRSSNRNNRQEQNNRRNPRNGQQQEQNEERQQQRPQRSQQKSSDAQEQGRSHRRGGAEQVADGEQTTQQAAKDKRPTQRRNQRPEQAQQDREAVASTEQRSDARSEQRQEQRPERQPQKDQRAQAAEKPVELDKLDATAVEQQAQDEQGQSGRTRRSRDRYGRDRRQQRNDRSTDAPQDQDGDVVSAAPTPATAVVAKAVEEPKQEPAVQVTTQAKAPAKTAAPKQEEVASEPVEEKKAKKTAARKKAPAKKAKEASATAYALPKDELENVATKAGLQWVSTNADRVKEAQANIENEPKPKMGRKIKPVDVVKNEALVMVETQKEIN